MKAAYDVVVVGAGPAGSLAAWSAAERGLDVLLIEKRQEIGSPVRCAEGVGLEGLRRFIQPDPRWICAEITHFSLHSADGTFVRVPAPEKNFVLERKIFDRELAHRAAQAGASVLVKTQATGLLQEDGHVVGVQLTSFGRPYEVAAKLVIAADGVESQVARWAGLNTVPRRHDYVTCAEFLLSGVDIDQHTCQFHIGHSLAPGGYAWVFPKGDGKANVGLGIGSQYDERRTAKGDEPSSALTYLEQFVAKRFPTASQLALILGGVPTSGALREMVADGLMVVGDAAHQNEPLSGSGITNGMTAGQIAGEVAAEAIRAGDCSKKMLSRYPERWNAIFAKAHRRAYRIKEAFLRVPEPSLKEAIALAASLPVDEMSLPQLVLAALKHQPRLLFEVRAFFQESWLRTYQ